MPRVSSDDCARRAPTPRTASGEEEGAGGGGSNKLALTGVVGGHENGGREAGRAACARTWLPVVTRPGSAVDGASDCGPWWRPSRPMPLLGCGGGAAEGGKVMSMDAAFGGCCDNLAAFGDGGRF